MCGAFLGLNSSQAWIHHRVGGGGCDDPGWQLAASFSILPTNLSPASAFIVWGAGKDPAWGIFSTAVCRHSLWRTHTLASDQYQALREAYKFCTVMATPCDRWDATDITSSVDWLPALSAFWILFDQSLSFFIWHVEIKENVITDLEGSSKGTFSLIKMYKKGFEHWGMTVFIIWVTFSPKTSLLLRKVASVWEKSSNVSFS